MQASNVTELRGREEAKNITARQGKRSRGDAKTKRRSSSRPRLVGSTMRSGTGKVNGAPVLRAVRVVVSRAGRGIKRAGGAGGPSSECSHRSKANALVDDACAAVGAPRFRSVTTPRLEGNEERNHTTAGECRFTPRGTPVTPTLLFYLSSLCNLWYLDNGRHAAHTLTAARTQPRTSCNE